LIEATPHDHAGIMDNISDLLVSMRTALDA